MASPFRVVADIGATWARFRLQGEDGSLLGQFRVPTPTFGAGDAFPQRLKAVCADAGVGWNRLAGLVLAVAGPVRDGQARVTNGQLALSESELSAALKCPVLICNDFFALAHGLNHFAELRPIGSAAVDPGSVRVVLGPGSGLGMALCVPVGGGGAFRVLPSEGGHAPLAARTQLEHELMRVLQSQSATVAVWETVLSGPGLMRLYRALARVRGEPATHAAPEAVTAAALADTDALATATLEQFGAWLGDCAASLALTACAEGGVYLVGDLLRAVGEPIATGPLRQRFDDRDVMAGYASRIAIQRVLDPDPGLVGAAVLATAQAD